MKLLQDIQTAAQDQAFQICKIDVTEAQQDFAGFNIRAAYVLEKGYAQILLVVRVPSPDLGPGDPYVEVYGLSDRKPGDRNQYGEPYFVTERLSESGDYQMCWDGKFWKKRSWFRDLSNALGILRADWLENLVKKGGAA